MNRHLSVFQHSCRAVLIFILCTILTFGMLAASVSASAASIWTNVVDVIACEGFTVGLRSDGTVLYAGDDTAAARNFSTWKDVVRLEKQGWLYIVGYQADGGICLQSFDPWGYSDLWTQEELSGWKGIRDLQIEYDFCAGLCSDGTVVLVSRGPDISRYMNNKISSWQNIVQIIGGGYGLLGLRQDGGIEYAGCSEDSEENWGIDSFIGLQGIRELVNGEYGPYAIRYDGTIVPGDSGNFHGIKKLYFASDSMFGLRQDGTVAVYYYYDDPRLNEVASWRNVVDLGFTVDGWARYVPAALCADGTVRTVTRGYGGEPYGEWDVSGWSGVSQLYSGSYYTIGLKRDGTLLVTGGEFGSFDFLSQLRSWNNIIGIYASHCESMESGHIVGLRADGTVVAAGNNTHGQCNVG